MRTYKVILHVHIRKHTRHDIKFISDMLAGGFKRYSGDWRVDWLTHDIPEIEVLPKEPNYTEVDGDIGMLLEDLDLRVRTYNALRACEMFDMSSDVSQFLKCQHPCSIKNFGQMSFMDMIRALLADGVSHETILQSVVWNNADQKWRKRFVEITDNFKIEMVYAHY